MTMWKVRQSKISRLRGLKLHYKHSDLIRFSILCFRRILTLGHILSVIMFLEFSISPFNMRKIRKLVIVGHPKCLPAFRKVYLVSWKVYPLSWKVYPVSRKVYPVSQKVYPVSRKVYPVSPKDDLVYWEFPFLWCRQSLSLSLSLTLSRVAFPKF